MRDHLAHRYFDTDHAIIQATIEKTPLVAAAERLTQHLAPEQRTAAHLTNPDVLVARAQAAARRDEADP